MDKTIQTNKRNVTNRYYPSLFIINMDNKYFDIF